MIFFLLICPFPFMLLFLSPLHLLLYHLMLGELLLIFPFPFLLLFLSPLHLLLYHLMLVDLQHCLLPLPCPCPFPFLFLWICLLSLMWSFLEVLSSPCDQQQIGSLLAVGQGCCHVQQGFSDLNCRQWSQPCFRSHSTLLIFFKVFKLCIITNVRFRFCLRCRCRQPHGSIVTFFVMGTGVAYAAMHYHTNYHTMLAELSLL